MTQTMFAPPPVGALPADEPTGGSRRTVLVAGALVTALALGGGGYVLLSGGSSDSPTAAPMTHRPGLAAKPVVKKPAAPVANKSSAQVPTTSTAPIGRDPFRALYVEPVAAAPVAGTSTATTGTGTSTTAGSSATTTTPVVAAYNLKLLSISGSGNNGRFFTFSVAGVKKTVIAGQRFGKHGELVALTWVSSSTGKNLGAIVQVGDDNPVDVKVGQTISVQ